MGFDLSDFDHETSGGFGPYEAEVINAGVTEGKFGPQMIFLCKPTNPQRRPQTLFMGMGKGEYVFGGVSDIIVTGDGEKAFETKVYKEIVEGPKIKVVTKAGLFLNALKHLGLEMAGADMTAFVGLKLDLEEIKFNDAIKRFNKAHPDSTLGELSGEYANAKITIPTKIISMPVKKVSLKEAVLEVIDGKTEEEMVFWYKGTDLYDGTATTPLYRVLTELEKTEVLIVNDKYMVKKETKVGGIIND